MWKDILEDDVDGQFYLPYEKYKNVKFKATAVSTYSRFATIGLLILFAAKYQELIAMWGLGVGLLTGYLVMIIDFLYLEYKSREER